MQIFDYLIYDNKRSLYPNHFFFCHFILSGGKENIKEGRMCWIKGKNITLKSFQTITSVIGALVRSSEIFTIEAIYV